MKKGFDFEPGSPFVTGKVCYQYNSSVTGACMAYRFGRNSREKTCQTEWLFESKLRPFDYFKGYAEPSCKGNSLMSCFCKS